MQRIATRTGPGVFAIRQFLRRREDFVASGPLARRTPPQGRDISSK